MSPLPTMCPDTRSFVSRPERARAATIHSKLIRDYPTRATRDPSSKMNRIAGYGSRLCETSAVVVMPPLFTRTLPTPPGLPAVNSS